MEGFLIFIGFLGWAVVNGWVTLAVFFATVPTFGEALFTGGRSSKLCGVLLWVVSANLWVAWACLGFNYE